MSITANIAKIRETLPSNVKLVAVSKFKPVSSIIEAYEAGERAFAESRPQEFVQKVQQLPADIEWHFIGHLQTNKIKFVVPYASLIQSVDSEHLLVAIENYAAGIDKIQDVLLELHIAKEESKQGFSADELMELLPLLPQLSHIRVCGIMAMASLTDDMGQVKAEFDEAASIATEFTAKAGIESPQLSIGMTGDYKVAIGCGATMVRIGSAIFGAR
ncbi:MAG: YggS family pyridoxal phosphate-dependent enzyme [Bacteroidales bacterium]|nr:YggS family pyridoxal phosphate-dependent enzyme [Bacteroidales bacterium]